MCYYQLMTWIIAQASLEGARTIIQIQMVFMYLTLMKKLIRRLSIKELEAFFVKISDLNHVSLFLSDTTTALK